MKNIKKIMLNIYNYRICYTDHSSFKEMEETGLVQAESLQDALYIVKCRAEMFKTELEHHFISYQVEETLNIHNYVNHELECLTGQIDETETEVTE